jgi:hypothetical protein
VPAEWGVKLGVELDHFKFQIVQGAAANLVFNEVVGSDWKAALQLND